MTLVLVGLVGGIITGLSPCVLPVLPVVFLGGGAAESEPGQEPARRRPYFIVLGLTVSFAVFTLFGSLILSSLHLPDDAIRWAGLVLLVAVGLGLLVPALGHLLERPFYRFPQRFAGTGGNGFVLGIALGAVFVPCAGPVLAAITVAGATDHVGLRTVGLTLGFAVGTAIPLLVFALAGRGLTHRQSITAGAGAGINLAFHASDVYLDVGGTGTLTVTAGGRTKVIAVSGAPDIYTVATEQPAQDGTVSIRLSPGLQAYSFTFG